MKLLPINDLLFKKVFTTPGNEYVLKGFVQAVLGLEFEHLETKETYNIKRINPEKITRTEVDILAQTLSGEYITIEMQVRNHAAFIERTLYYLFQKYNDQYQVDGSDKEGPYTSLKSTYGINITDFNLFKPDSDAVRHFVC